MAYPATDEWLATYGHRLDDLRAALDRAFGLDGDGVLAVALTTSAVALWYQLSMPRCDARPAGEVSHPARANHRAYIRA